MIASMTAFGRHQRMTQLGDIIWEIRSVNHRYLETTFKLPDSCKSQELDYKALVATYLRRGKVECQLHLTQTQSLAPINLPMVQQLLAYSEQISDLFKHQMTLSPIEVLQWPGVLDRAVANDALLPMVAESLQVALHQVQSCRYQEGAKLKNLLIQKLFELEQVLAQAKTAQSLGLEAYQAKITQQLVRLIQTNELEVASQYANRLDATEELDRLATHIQAVSQALNCDEPVGRRLDFLMQELHREANTLGAKAASAQVSQAVITMKVLIEQMREQIQNVE